jgi:LemA protein
MEWVVIGIVLALVVLVYAWYVALISRRNKAREALASVDVHLQKRFDLLPNVLKLAQKFMTHEKGLMERLTQLRAEVGRDYARTDPAAVKGHLDAAKQLEVGMTRLFAVAENYPELRSSDTIVEAQRTSLEIEAQIAAARRFYNAAVNSLNNSVEIFPGSMIAGWAKVQALPFYEVETAEARKAIDVDDYIKP